MRKKGVSPLIASVLIIAFVIILFGLVTTWVRRAAIEPGMSGAEERIASEFECAKFNFKIISASKNAANTEVKLTIENLGDKDLKDLSVRTIGPDGVSNIETTLSPLAALERVDKTISGFSGTSVTGEITKIEVYPEIAPGKVCQGQLKSVTNIGSH